MANMEERLEATVFQAERDGAKWHNIIHGDENSTVETENGNVPTVSKQLKDVQNAIISGVSEVIEKAQTDLNTIISNMEVDSEKWHTIIHGDDESIVNTDNGDIPTVSKQLKDIRDAITGGVLDVVTEAQSARDDAISAKNVTLQLSQDTEAIKQEVITLNSNAAEANEDILQRLQSEAETKLILFNQTGEQNVRQSKEQADRAEYFANDAEIKDYSIYQRILYLSSSTIVLEDMKTIYQLTVNNDITLAFDVSQLTKTDKVITFELILEIPEVHTIIFPTSLRWLDGVTPNLGTVGTYLLTFRSMDFGTSWVGNLQGTI